MLFLSRYLIPGIIFYIVGFGLLSRRPVFEDFIHGAKQGIITVLKITPTLIGLITAVGFLRSSGFLDFLGKIIALPAAWIHVPAPLVPLVLVRMISNSAAIGLVLDLFRVYGPDSYIGAAASIIMGCTESVLYCISIYFGSINIRKTRYVFMGSMVTTIAGVVASLVLAELFMKTGLNK